MDTFLAFFVSDSSVDFLKGLFCGFLLAGLFLSGAFGFTFKQMIKHYKINNDLLNNAFEKQKITYEVELQTLRNIIKELKEKELKTNETLNKTFNIVLDKMVKDLE